ncbi:S-layer homology domain-containing protein [Thermophilibacter mediterraneus]|uniref:S-layer homology domain-containing protein n=1 Tax=Thermophilibacter mediterraneus TaxID=1871031 RepID=UPI003209033C
MTACTNNGGSRARRAVTAALVGVLSVGAAPMVALATGAAPASGDVSLQAATSDTVWNGTVAYDGEDRATFTYNGKAQGTEAVSLTPQGTEMSDVELEYYPADSSTPGTDEYYYFYVELDSASSTTWMNGTESVTYKNAKGASVDVKGNAVAKPSAIGDYAVMVGRWNGSGWDLVKSAYTFSIKAQSLDDANLFEINSSDLEDTSDRDFAYNGENGCDQVSTFLSTLGVELGGTVLDEGAGNDYTVQIYELNGKSPLSGSDWLVPGTQYVAKLSGEGVYDGLSVDKTFTYGKLNLASANIETNLFTAASGNVPSASSSLADIVSKINGVTIPGNFQGAEGLRIAIKCTGVPSGSTAGAKGTYTFELSANGEAGAKYVEGTKEVTVTYADFQADVDFTGCADGIGASDTSMTTDLSKDKPNYFDPSEIKVTYIDGSTKELDEDQYDVTITDANGVEVDADALKQPGEYTVKVSVNYTNDYDQLIAGEESFKVTVNYGTVDGSNIYVSYDGKNVPATGFDTPYTGEDMLDGIAVKSVKGDKTFVEGTDYTVEVTRLGSDGKWVAADEIVNAGDYKVTVKGISWKGTETFEFEVTPVTLTSAVPANPFAVADDVKLDGNIPSTNTVYYLNHTGEELVPELSFKDAKGNVWTLDADSYEATYEVRDGVAWDAADLKDEGVYHIKSVKITDKNFVASSTLALPNGTYIVVTNTRSFVDVPNDAWYAEAVATAKQQGYIGGVGGSNLFAPMRNMSRADVVCVLYRMAGGTIDNEGMTDAEKTYISDFTDVDEGAYYAKAVSWAVKTGVARGYGDTFGTSREVTTEEFATMLHRYATLIGNADSVDTDAVLAGVADGDQVSSYARDAVAWAVENGYVASNGNLIDPQGSVYRARVVTIAVRYQPEQLHVIL